MNSEKHYRIKLWQGKDLGVKQVTKGRKANELPGALFNVVFWELKNGKKLRMLQKEVKSSCLAGDIKQQ